MAGTAGSLIECEWAVEVLQRAGVNPTAALATVFVPTTRALQSYAAVDSTATEALTTSAGADVVSCHTIPGVLLTVADFPEGATRYASRAGTDLLVVKSGNRVSVTSGGFSASVVTPNITHGNAVVHTVDNVLAPVANAVPASMADLQWATQAAFQAGLDPTLSQVTAFTPSDAAIARYHAADPGSAGALKTSAGADAVRAHLVPGVSLPLSVIPDGASTFTTMAGTVITINKLGSEATVSSGSYTANIITPNLGQGNATIHIIDGILAPIIPQVATAANLGWATESLARAGVNPLLMTSTVFAPTDDALARSCLGLDPMQVVANLEGTAGAAAVSAHIIPSVRLGAASINQGTTTYTSLAGTPITLTKTGSAIKVESGPFTANVIATDLAQGGCTCHIIDAALACLGMPPSSAAAGALTSPPPAAATPASAAADVGAGIPATPPSAASAARPVGAAAAPAPATEPAAPIAAAAGGAAAAPAGEADVAAAATAQRALEDMAWAIESARQVGLTGNLTGQPATVFAPSDTAISRFAELNPGARKGLDASAILAYIVPGHTLLSSSLPEGTSHHTTLAGTPLTVSKMGDAMAVAVGGNKTARVIRPDIKVGCAVIHVVDAVLEV